MTRELIESLPGRIRRSMGMRMTGGTAMLLDFSSRKTVTLFVLLLAFGALAGQAFAQEARPGGAGFGGGPRPIAVHSLRDGVYWTDGGPPSNTGIIVGTDGV